MALKRLLCFLALTALLCPSAFSSPRFDYDDVAIQADDDYSVVSGWRGYAELRFKITNKSNSNDAAVRFETEGNARAVKSIVVPPSATANFSIFLPVGVFINHHCRFIVNGKAEDPFWLSSGYYSGHSVFAGKQKGFRLNETLTQRKSVGGTTKSYTASDDIHIRMSSRELNEWSDNWLAYSSYSAVFMTLSEFLSAPIGVRTALRGFAELGGNLTLVGGDEKTFRKNFPEKILKADAEYLRVRVGLGSCFWAKEEDPGKLSATAFKEMKAAWASGQSEWSATNDYATLNRTCAVKKDLAVPVKTLTAMTLLFILIVGPLNMFYLYLKNKRVLLLVTVPAISAVFSLLLIMFFVFGEGFEKLSRIQTVTLLKQDTGRAATMGLASFYSTLSPGGGLRFDKETELTLQNTVETYGRKQYDGSYLLVWDKDQNLRSGFITAKIPAIFTTRRYAATGEKIEFFKDSETVSVTNGLGAKIKKLWYVDPVARKIYAPPAAVDAGAIADLKEVSMPTNATTTTLAPSNIVDIIADPEIDPRRFQDFVDGAYYIAILETNPFIGEALAGAKPVNHENMVIGSGLNFRNRRAR